MYQPGSHQRSRYSPPYRDREIALSTAAAAAGGVTATARSHGLAEQNQDRENNPFDRSAAAAAHQRIGSRE